MSDHPIERLRATIQVSYRKNINVNHTVLPFAAIFAGINCSFIVAMLIVILLCTLLCPIGNKVYHIDKTRHILVLFKLGSRNIRGLQE